MRNAMRTLLALFVLTAVTAALLLQLQIRHPLQATQGSDPETASFLSLRSAVFAAVTALSPMNGAPWPRAMALLSRNLSFPISGPSRKTASVFPERMTARLPCGPSSP